MRSLVFGNNAAQRFTVVGNELSAVLGEAVFKQLAVTLRKLIRSQEKLTVLARVVNFLSLESSDAPQVVHL